MKINPINSTYLTNTNTTSFKRNKLAAMINHQAKKILLPTTFALAMFTPIKMSAQNISSKANETELIKSKNPNLPYYIQEESIQYSKDFKMDNKIYTMFYTDYCQKFSDKKDAVLEIFFVPEDFELMKKGSVELNSPLKLEQLVYHNLDSKKENFVSAIVSESFCEKDGTNYQFLTKEIRLPKKIGKELLNLYQGKTKFSLVTGVDTYTETYTDSMMKPVLSNGQKVLNY